MRQFVAEVQPDEKGCIIVEGKKFRYLSTVLRVSAGDMMYVRLPSGALQQMTVAQVDACARKILLTVAGELSPSAGTIKAAPVAERPSCELWLFMFAAKPPKMDLIIRQAVECGVSVIVPVAGKFSQASSVESARKKSSGTDERWGRIITEACEQSGSPVRTKVLPCASLEEACGLWNARREGKRHASVVLYEQTAGTKMLHEAVPGGFSEGAPEDSSLEMAAVMVGAEGGIAPEEIEYVRKQGFTPVHFATNILRCETAALYGIAALQNVIVENKIWQFKK